MNTLNRKKWWESLSPREKYLRETIWALENERSREKRHASETWSSVTKRYGIARINNLTAHIRALKHELEHKTTMVCVAADAALYRCLKCQCVTIKKAQDYCMYCGRKIKEWR